jgi:excisionase family DNA binding protein
VYTVSEIAQILDLHPKTVRRLIRDGRVRARKIGREWRVTKEDLRDYAHAELASRPEEERSPLPLADRVRVSAVIELDEGNSEEVSRISNSLLAVLSGKDPAWGESRYDLVFQPETRKARFVLNGSPYFIRTLLELVEALMGQEPSRPGEAGQRST